MTEYRLNNRFNDAFKQAAFGVSLGENNQLAEFAKALRSGSQMAELDLASLYGNTGNGASADRIGKTERQVLGNLARVSDADLSMHAPWSINPSGINPESRQKDPQYETQMRNETRAAINFADDVSKSMGRKNMPIIFHAASDHFGNPDPSTLLTIYDTVEKKVLPLIPRINMTEGAFIDIYGKEKYNLIKDGLKTTEDGKTLIPTPDAFLEWQKDQAREAMIQQQSSLEVQRRNLEAQKFDLANKLASASLEGDSNEIARLTKEQTRFEMESKTIEKEKREFEYRVANIDKQYVKFSDIAPNLAAEGIKDAAIMSAKSVTKPMVLVENTMTPDMSLSRPADVAKTVEQARRLFVEAAMKDPKLELSRGDAEELSKELIGVNLDVGHLNLFKSYGKKDRDIINMLTETGKMDDQTRVSIADYVKRYHLNDNMGNTDAHLPLGEGTTPIKEIFETLKNAGVEAPSIMEVFGGLGGIEAGQTQSLEYLGAPLFGDTLYKSLPGYADMPYSSIIGDYANYSQLGLRNDFFAYGGFSGLSPMLGGGYMENAKGGGGGFSGAPMV